MDDFPTDWADAREKAGLLWEPVIRPFYSLNAAAAVCDLCSGALNSLHNPVDGDLCPAFSDEHPLVGPNDISAANLAGAIAEVKSHRLVARDDTNATLGVVSEQFSLVSHSVMGEILESVLGLTNVKFETAGSVKGGATVWALAYLDEPLTIANDDTETYPFVVLINHHDGSGACRLINTSVRVVCWNTTRAAEMQGEKSGRQFTFRHTGDVLGRIEEAKLALAGVRDDAHEWDALATELFGLKADEVAFNHFVSDFIPEPPAEIVSERVRNNVANARKVFKSIYLDSLTTDSHRGTALGLVDASVEYLDHVRGYRNRDTLLGRTLLRPEPLKAKAVSLAREHCR